MICLLYPFLSPRSFFFFFNDTATTEIYTLSLHDALPISGDRHAGRGRRGRIRRIRLRLEVAGRDPRLPPLDARSEEHTSELQSRLHLVCRLLLEKKKKKKNKNKINIRQRRNVIHKNT